MSIVCLECEEKNNIQTSVGWFFVPVGIVALFLLLVSCLFVWLIEPRAKELSMWLWNGILIFGLSFWFWNAVSLFVLFTVKSNSLFSIWAWNFLTFLFQITQTIGKAIGLPIQKIQQGAIQFSNYSFLKKDIRLAPEKILILIPHCIQKDTCGLKVTIDAQNCKRCGQCNVGELADLALEYGVHLAIVPGGTLARKRIIEIRPKAVLAIACERDLTSGIQDVFPIPVFGVLNNRPFGPCINTQVDMGIVRGALQKIVIKEK